MDSLIVVHPSTLAIPTLEPIPQSVAPTPSLRESPPPNEAGPANTNSNSNIPLDHQQSLPSPSDFAGSSRRSSISSYYPIPGSYFPGPSNSKQYYDASSGTNTPSEKPRPSPINIPAATPDEPLFSAYPDTGSSKPDIKGKGKAFHLPLKPSFNLSNTSLSRRRRNEEAEESSADEWRMPVASSSRYPQAHHTHHSHHVQSHPHHNSPSRPKSPIRNKPARKRAATITNGPAVSEFATHRKSASTSAAEDEKQSHSPNRTLRLGAVPRPKSLGGFRRRRASVGSGPIEVEYEPPGSKNHWKKMPEEVAQKFDSPPLPFSYQQPQRSDYTLQSVSTTTTVRPFASHADPQGSDMVPLIAPRRSSLSGVEPPILLGLTNISRTLPAGGVDIIIPEDMVMPHDPPPRGSSLDQDGVVVEIKSKEDPSITASASAIIVDDHEHPLLSASLTNTDTSTTESAAAFSPSTSSKEHPLSSATTSLSRSAKSGKEGNEDDDVDDKDASLSAIRLQRSLEWEAKQNRLRRKLEKRIMIILELAETEVAYTEDLRTLCHVYLPQLAALPSVNERNAKMVARNTEDLLVFHAVFAGKMVEILKEEGLGYDYARDGELGSAGKVDRISRKIAALFVDDITHFSLYRDFCAESIIATTLVKHISERVDYEGFERRCQIIGGSQPLTTLRDLLDESGSSVSHHRSRLHFKDYLITPIQRICRYPLLLGQLLDAAGTTSPQSESESTNDEGYDVGVDLERALGAMRGVAEEADEARRLKDAEVKSATVLDRLEPHPNLTPAFIRSLGTCRLIGSLDVLHHHPTLAPLLPPVKVKYLAAFLYRGYLILAKVKKGKNYEAKHFLPLEVFELIDITEGFLPHSIRLTLRDHNFDLAASCEAEKDVWASAICEARDESVIPPFELPASVSPFPVRARRSSTAFSGDFDVHANPHPIPKRYTLVGAPSELDEFNTKAAESTTIIQTISSKPSTPLISPIKSTFGFTPERKSNQAGTILLRRASNSQRILVERGLSDLFSDICSTVRSKAQLQRHTLFLPDIPSFNTSENLDGHMSSKDSSTMLRRRKSFLDHRSRRESIDIAITGEVKGSVIELRPTKSSHGRYRTLPLSNSISSSVPRRRAGSVSSVTRGNNNNNESGEDESASVTATAISDFGTLGRNSGIRAVNNDFSRKNSMSSIHSHNSPMITPRRSLSSLRPISGNIGTGYGGGLEEETIMMRSKEVPNSRQRYHSQPATTSSSSSSNSYHHQKPQPPRSKSFKLENNRNRNKQNLSLSFTSSLPYSLRARSTPVSPILSPTDEIPPLPTNPKMPPLIQKSKSDESPRKLYHHQNRSITKSPLEITDSKPLEPETSTVSASTSGGITEYFIPPPHDSPLDTIGSNVPLPTSTSGIGFGFAGGLTGSGSTSKIDLEKPISTTSWGKSTLRRSMSFLPLRRSNSVISLRDDSLSNRNSNSMEHSNSNSGSASGSGSGPGSRSGSASGCASAEGSEDNHDYSGGNNNEKSNMFYSNTGSSTNFSETEKYSDMTETSGNNGWKSVPTTPKRKKSLRLFGLKGFTPM
ncbi:uncharacterized protein L201_005160 [Kwoniella dendrophila CBS 6074]|uniref:DH domain-containing protein n=1 Tax=Kwoniella dendrophila CBS 6074 TaxID=1295534 RepID=A0AAX4JY02_9TREE